MTELLLQKGADMNVVDEKGATPLHAAAKCGRVVVIELLLKREARMHKVDNKGTEQLVSLIRTSCLVTLTSLRKHSATCRSQIRSDCGGAAVYRLGGEHKDEGSERTDRL